MGGTGPVYGVKAPVTAEARLVREALGALGRESEAAAAPAPRQHPRRPTRAAARRRRR